jgi:transposase
MRAYSNDLRLRVIEAIQANVESQGEIAERYGVSQSFVEKLWQRFRTTGNYGAKAHAGGVKRALREDEALLRQLVQAQPDATLAELCERVAQQTGKPIVTTATMCVELQRLQLPRKKRRFTPSNETASASN